MPKKKKTMACGELAMVKASDGRAAAEWNSAFIGDWGISPTSSAESRMAIQGHCLPVFNSQIVIFAHLHIFAAKEADREQVKLVLQLDRSTMDALGRAEE